MKFTLCRTMSRFSTNLSLKDITFYFLNKYIQTHTVRAECDQITEEITRIYI